MPVFDFTNPPIDNNEEYISNKIELLDYEFV